MKKGTRIGLAVFLMLLFLAIVFIVLYFILWRHKHDFSAEWTSDAQTHWHACECGARGEEAKHTFGDPKTLKAATCIEAGSEEYLRMAFWACVFLWLWNLVIGLTICWFYGKGRALKKGLPAVLLLSLVQGGGELLMTRVSTTLACFLPACVSLILVVVLGRTRSYREKWQLEDSGRKHLMRKKGLRAAAEPLLYLLPAIIFFIAFTYYRLIILS